MVEDTTTRVMTEINRSNFSSRLGFGTLKLELEELHSGAKHRVGGWTVIVVGSTKPSRGLK